MNWLWMNIPLGTLFVAAWSGIPIWLVLKHPGWGAEPPDVRHRADAEEPAQPPARQIPASPIRPLADIRG